MQVGVIANSVHSIQVGDLRTFAVCHLSQCPQLVVPCLSAPLDLHRPTSHSSSAKAQGPQHPALGLSHEVLDVVPPVSPVHIPHTLETG